MWADILTSKEAQYCERLSSELQGMAWIKQLVNRIEDQGGITDQTKPLLFELRFAYELNRQGVDCQYEYKTGVGSSTVDFQVLDGEVEWLIELVSIRVSDPVRDATRHEGDLQVVELASHAPDRRRTPEAAMIRAQEKIVEKVFCSDIGSTKFPPSERRSLPCHSLRCAGVPPQWRRQVGL